MNGQDTEDEKVGAGLGNAEGPDGFIVGRLVGGEALGRRENTAVGMLVGTAVG